MLEFQNVSVQYGDRPNILHKVSLTLRKGDIVCLVGKSGSGKSSLLRAALGVLPENGSVTEGDILLDEISLLPLKEKEWRQIRGKRITFIPQDTGSALDPVMTIGRQFSEYIRAHEAVSGKEARTLSLKMLREVSLPDPESIMNCYPWQLSGGMRQRVGIAMAMALRPEYLLADEPTSALDVITQAQIARQLLDLRKIYDAGILMITHNLALAAYLSDRIYVLKSGTIVEQGTREDILNHPRSMYTRALLQAVPCIGGERYV